MIVMEKSREISNSAATVKRWPRRYTQAALLMLSTFLCYFLRMNTSVAVVAMASSTSWRVELSSVQKGAILSGFFWGYLWLQTPAGHFSRRSIATTLISVALATSSLINILSPIAVFYHGPQGMVALRVINGLAQGVVYPCVVTLVSRWMERTELEVILTIIYTGADIGTVISLMLGGYICQTIDWPYMFYIFGSCGLILSLMYHILSQEWPDDTTEITQENKVTPTPSKSSRDVTPWSQIFSSAPVWALVLVYIGSSWATWTLSSLTPTYLSGVFHFDLQEGGFFSSFPSLAKFLLSLAFSQAARIIKKYSLMTVRTMRMMWTSIGLLGGSVCLVALAYLQPDASGAIFLLTMTTGLNAACNPGFASNHGELSLHYSGILMGITETLANLASIFGPLVSTYIMTNNEDLLKWKLVFLLCAFFNFLANTIFLLWGSTDQQPWDNTQINL